MAYLMSQTPLMTTHRPTASKGVWPEMATHCVKDMVKYVDIDNDITQCIRRTDTGENKPRSSVLVSSSLKQ